MSNEVWITAMEAARRLGINFQTLPRVVKAGGVRTKELPGTSKRFSASDIDRLLVESIRSNGPEPQPAQAARG